MNELSIHINIAGRAYPLTVAPDEEANVRNAGKYIQEKLQAYHEQFALKDQQDALALYALEITAQLQKLQDQQSKQVAELERELDKIIQAI